MPDVRVTTSMSVRWDPDTSDRVGVLNLPGHIRGHGGTFWNPISGPVLRRVEDQIREQVEANSSIATGYVSDEFAQQAERVDAILSDFLRSSLEQDWDPDTATATRPLASEPFAYGDRHHRLEFWPEGGGTWAWEATGGAADGDWICDMSVVDDGNFLIRTAPPYPNGNLACDGEPWPSEYTARHPCGDGICEGAETWENCQVDCLCEARADPELTGTLCPASRYGACGDGVCATWENCLVCPADCGPCNSGMCGNFLCQGPFMGVSVPETCDNCPQDCTNCAQPACGDYRCDFPWENVETCGTDCESVCGDGVCVAGELPSAGGPACLDCLCGTLSGLTCEPSCGDGRCDPLTESCATCPADCGAPDHAGVPVCGDGRCANDQEIGCLSESFCPGRIAAEDCQTCPEDCGACWGLCGNGLCDASELRDPLGACVSDCGALSCGDGLCTPVEVGRCGEDCLGDGVCEGVEASVPWSFDIACEGDGICSARERAGRRQLGGSDADEPACDFLSICGDGRCDPDENVILPAYWGFCPADCGFVGDGICDLPGESGSEDCFFRAFCFGYPGGGCPPTMDGVCTPEEVCDPASHDCPTVCDFAAENCGEGQAAAAYSGSWCDVTAGCGTCCNNYCVQARGSAECAATCSGPDELFAPEEVCGDRICHPTEMRVCPGDCDWCGDGECDPDEERVCATDCEWCGDGDCPAGEEQTCPQDCGFCGDGHCWPHEEGHCLADCSYNRCSEIERTDPRAYSARCDGDGICSAFELAAVATGFYIAGDTLDCEGSLPVCGDSICEPPENVVLPAYAGFCPADCGYAGDGICVEGDAEELASADCAPDPWCRPPFDCSANGDGVCTPAEVCLPDGLDCPTACDYAESYCSSGSDGWYFSDYWCDMVGRQCAGSCCNGYCVQELGLDECEAQCLRVGVRELTAPWGFRSDTP